MIGDRCRETVVRQQLAAQPFAGCTVILSTFYINLLARRASLLCSRTPLGRHLFNCHVNRTIFLPPTRCARTRRPRSDMRDCGAVGSALAQTIIPISQSISIIRFHECTIVTDKQSTLLIIIYIAYQSMCIRLPISIRSIENTKII